MTSKIKTRAVVASAALLLLAGTGAAATANATPRPTALAGSALASSSAVAHSFAVKNSASVISAGTGAGVAAKPKPKSYKNCTALRKVYPHGVGRKGAKDKVRGGGKPVTTWTVDTRTYDLNKKSDRDKDGVACEKK